MTFENTKAFAQELDAKDNINTVLNFISLK
jgi:hypothetical protein